MDDAQSKVIEWINSNQSLLVEITQQLVRIPSITGQEKDVQEFIYTKLEQLQLSPKFVYPDIEKLRQHEDFFETTSFVKFGYEDRPNVVGLWKGTGIGFSVCLSGHIDVVSPEPVDDWIHGPWSGGLDEGKIYGRGSADMKAGVAAMIFAVEALQKCGISLEGDVTVETTIEEEDGGVGGNLYMRMTQPPADAAINPEPGALHLGIASAGVMYFRVTIPGIPAHAATAHFGVNAIHRALPIIEALDELHIRRQERISYLYAEQDPRMIGKATTINLGTIHAGDWPSTVPGSCMLEYRVGWPPGETREEIRTEIEQVIGDASSIDNWLSEHPPVVEWFGWNAKPHEQDIQDRFIQLMQKKTKEIALHDPVFYGGAAGLDTRFFAAYDIPSVVLGPKGERTHSTDECVYVDSIVNTASIIAAVLLEWCGVSS